MTKVPEHIRHWLDAHAYCSVAEVGGGGSDASLILVKRNSGQAAIVKWASVAERQVDGHGPTALVRKAEHQIWLRTNAEWFAHTYPQILLVSHRAGSFTVTDYVEGTSLDEHAIAIVTGKGPGSGARAESLVNGYLATIESGLAAGVGTFSAGNWPVADSLCRVERRLLFMSGAVDDNCKDIAAGRWLLSRLISSCQSFPLHVLADLVWPGEPVTGFPLHGDLNLANMLVGNEWRHHLIDPAGIRRWRDPAYDIAKALFHLTLIIPVKLSSGMGTWNDGSRVALQRMAGELLGLASSCGPIAPRSIVRRLIGYYVCHILSEAACRISLAAQGYDSHRNLICASRYLLAGHEGLHGLSRRPWPASLTAAAAFDRVVLPCMEQGMTASCQLPA